MNESNNEVPEYEIWQIKSAVSEFLVPRLKLFREKVLKGETMCIPTWLEQDYDIANKSEVELNELWVEVLEKMIFPFEYELSGTVPSTMGVKNFEEKREAGLQLFARYFFNLWD